jgi:hypothetical protein
MVLARFQSSLRDFCYLLTPFPSDKSLGYFQMTLRVNMFLASRVHTECRLRQRCDG